MTRTRTAMDPPLVQTVRQHGHPHLALLTRLSLTVRRCFHIRGPCIHDIHLASPSLFRQSRFIHTSAVSKVETQVPDFGHYRTSNPEAGRTMSYFMVGSLGLIGASVGKSTVTEFLKSMSASADVLALAKVEVELAAISEGKNVVLKWRGKPIFIRHRTQSEIDEAKAADWKTFRDPQSDEDRAQRPEWLVMVGVCTHLGCVPIGEAGDYGGW